MFFCELVRVSAVVNILYSVPCFACSGVDSNAAVFVYPASQARVEKCRLLAIDKIRRMSEDGAILQLSPTWRVKMVLCFLKI